MKIINTKFYGLKIIKGVKHCDKRGYFRETFKNNLFKDKKFTFWCLSKSKKNVIRGLHFQKKFQQEKFVSVVKGKIFDVVVDIRKNSKSFGKFKSVILSDKNKKQIYIPGGFAHGYMTLSQTAKVEYICSNFYNKDHDVTIKWNDKKINIKWPKSSKYHISKKDQKGLNLSK